MRVYKMELVWFWSWANL